MQLTPRSTLKKHLLILDNDDRNVRALTEVAETLGWTVTSTWSGREGLAYIFRSHFDVVWLDHYLQDIYIGEVVETILKLPNAPKTVLMLRPSLGRIEYRKNHGRCLEIKKSYVSGLIQTLTGEFLTRPAPRH